MTASRGANATAYARAIERHWSQHAEHAVVISGREWALICDWHARGIPLDLVREAIEAAFEKRGRRRVPRSLSYIASAVDEAWIVVQRGRLDDDPAPAGSAVGGDPIGALRCCLERVGRVSLLGRLLESLLGRLAAGALPGEIDEGLDAALTQAVPAELLQEVTREVERRLEGFADRLPEATLDRTRRRATIDRLRGSLGLPRLG